MIPKRTAAEIDHQDLKQLIEQRVGEGRTIDYKEYLPLHGLDGVGDRQERERLRDAKKEEFLADVSSFANASGGDLVFGVTETQKIPQELLGVAGNLEHAVRDFKNLLLHKLQPRLVRMPDFVEVNDPENPFRRGPVLLCRIHKSWQSPHRVLIGKEKFYARDADGKHELDVTELRAAFLASETLAERIRNFRDDRIARILAGETPAPLADGPKVVTHLMPVQSCEPGFRLDLNRIRGSALERIGPPYFSQCAYEQRFNFDGYLFSTRPGPFPSGNSYAQIFHSGIVEIVTANLTIKEEDQNGIFAGDAEIAILRDIAKYMTLVHLLTVQPPVHVLVTVLGVHGYEVKLGRLARDAFYDEPRRIDRDDLFLPDVVMETYDQDSYPGILRPTFDALMQASGLPRSAACYDEEGNWKQGDGWQHHG